MAIILDGKVAAASIRNKKKEQCEMAGVTPSLCIVQGGDRPDSNQYVKNKIRACDADNIESTYFKIPYPNEDTMSYLDQIKEAILEANKKGDAVIVQRPIQGVPWHLEDSLIELIDTNKDVDSLKKYNEGMFYATSAPKLAPCTPLGILRLLEFYNIEIQGKKACVIGRSSLVGRPMAHLLIDNDATVTQCHSRTSKEDLYQAVDSADIIVCAVGKPNFINDEKFKDIDWSKKVLVDVGTNRVEDKWYGDISQDIKEKSYAYSPVPGGVGPMTIAMLLSKVSNRSMQN